MPEDLSALKPLYSLMFRMGSTLDLQHELSALVEELRKALSPFAIAVFMYDDQRENLLLEVQEGLPISHKLELPVGKDPLEWVRHKLGGMPTFGIPIVAEGQLLGSVIISTPISEPQLSAQLWLGQVMVNYAAPVLLNLRRYKELEKLVEKRTEELRRRNELLKTLNRIGQTISSMLNENELIEYLGREIGSLLDPSNLSISLYRPETQEVEVVFYLDDGLRQEGFKFPFGKGLISYVIKAKKPLLTSDYLLECRKLGVEPIGKPARSWLGVPIMSKGEVLGCISVWHYIKPDAFSQMDLEMLFSLASQTAIALENARLYEDAHRKAMEFSMLYEIGLATASTLDLEKLLTTLYEEISKVFNISTFYIGLLDESGRNVHLPLLADKGKRLPSMTLPLKEAGLGGWVIKTGQSLLIRDTLKEMDSLPVKPVQLGEIPHAWIGVPLKIRRQVLGVISIQNYAPHSFNEHHLKLLEAVANQAAIAIENARLFKKLKGEA